VRLRLLTINERGIACPPTKLSSTSYEQNYFFPMLGWKTLSHFAHAQERVGPGL